MPRNLRYVCTPVINRNRVSVWTEIYLSGGSRPADREQYGTLTLLRIIFCLAHTYWLNMYGLLLQQSVHHKIKSWIWRGGHVYRRTGARGSGLPWSVSDFSLATDQKKTEKGDGTWNLTSTRWLAHRKHLIGLTEAVLSFSDFAVHTGEIVRVRRIYSSTENLWNILWRGHNAIVIPDLSGACCVLDANNDNLFFLFVRMCTIVHQRNVYEKASFSIWAMASVTVRCSAWIS